MAQLHIEGSTLALRLTPLERVAGLHGDITVPVSAVTGVDVVDDGLHAARGMRAPGFAIPGRTKIGTWRAVGTRRFVVARRGSPAVRVQLHGEHFDELLVTVPDAPAVATALRAAAGSQEGSGR